MSGRARGERTRSMEPLRRANSSAVATIDDIGGADSTPGATTSERASTNAAQQERRRPGVGPPSGCIVRHCRVSKCVDRWSQGACRRVRATRYVEVGCGSERGGGRVSCLVLDDDDREPCDALLLQVCECERHVRAVCDASKLVATAML